MTAHELGERMNDHIPAMLERPCDIWCSKCVIHDQRKAVIVRDFRYRRDIEYVAARVADSLAVQQSGLGGDRLAEIFRIVRLDKYEVDTRVAAWLHRIA